MTKVLVNMANTGLAICTKFSAANCAAPAKTNSDIHCACIGESPASIASDPARIPQGIIATEIGKISITPCSQIGFVLASIVPDTR